MDCVFCKIIAGEIPSPRLYEDEKMIVIRDIDPCAKLHFLCIPKLHFPYLPTQDEQKIEYVTHCLTTIPRIATELGLGNGYRLIINQGSDAGQSVAHLHIHILGGQELPWPKF